MENLKSFMEQLPDLVMAYGIKVIFAIIIFYIGKYFASLSKRITVNVLSRKVDKTVSLFVANLAWAVVFTFTIIATLGQLGIQTASLVAILGAAGLAVGLALQGSLSNFASGVLLVMFRPCRAGDYIEAAGVAGVVDEITIFATRLKTPDNKIITLPNSSLMNGSITNFSMMSTRRLDLVIGVSYDADIKKAKQLLIEILENNEKVLKDPAYTVGLNDLADSSINFVVRPWVNSADFLATRFALLETIKLTFDEHGIGIPYPQMDIHVKELPSTPTH
ncbi:mechanosensitive ion channel [Shewanella sp. C32]|uniref:Small-conductance mechanosensitive channel n=1 Tax=Shewanella electrica TaxID=515560 RepID=A0ABT2FFI8_9GAMM|nr:mechanosensitive ion channel domain-containing protein [Shewanella electrica]MCH1925169.1 mechanosensitive ion channel [Shewanella electrica]MCS4554994.1 mechanosensitive ion channel [Shewanella electrica]